MNRLAGTQKATETPAAISSLRARPDAPEPTDHTSKPHWASPTQSSRTMIAMRG